MKLTKLQEKEIMRVHEAYWDSYLKGDVPSMTALLDEHYTQVGSAEGEVFSTKKGAVQFLYDTIDQVAGKLEMRNRVTKLELVETKIGGVLGSNTGGVSEDTLCIVHERADIYVLDGKEWIFYSKFRASTLLQKKGKEWKIIHQHSSFPDTRAEEGQNIATEKIAAENLQLREAVKRRTIELEQKSRALEIEASLERVRAVALSMRKPDDLPGICEVLFTELNALGFSEIRNAMINIHDDDKGTFINYDYSDEIGKSINHLHYNIHPLIEKQIKQIRSAGDAFSETSFTGKDLKEWKKFRKKIGEKDDPRIKNIDALHYYFYSIGTGSIGISTFSAITDEKRNVLKRFRNVFDFAYRRYMDVSQAEAQAKEAQIEVALERVRARAMAMHSSSELIDVANVLRDQMGLLGQHQIETMAIHLYTDDEELFDSWYAGRDQSGKLVSGTTRFKKDSCWLLREALAGYHSHQQEYDIEASGENLQEWLRVLVAAAPEYESMLKDFPEKSYYHITDFSGGSMIMVAYQPPTDETKALQKRCAIVFDLAYRRFLDIKQAEAQMREAQIELALERVRARTMAMHDSSELAETAQVLFHQFANMGGIPDRIAIGIVDEKNEVVNFWTTDQTGSQIAKSFEARLNESTTIAQAYAAWKSQEKFLLIDLQGKELKDWIHFAREEMGITVKVDFFKNRRVHHIATFSHGWIIVSTHQPQSPETINILERFASVFNLTFRRFLDLQKAEAQAREAQIQLALERVRASTMAMQHSDELQDTAILLFHQMKALGVQTGSCGFNIWNKEEKTATVWMSSADGALQTPFILPHTESAIYREVYEEMKNGETFLVKEVGGKNLKKHFDYLLTLPGIGNVLKKLRETGYSFPETMVYHFAFFSHGYLSFHLHEHHPETHDIFKRFGKVFDQTYTRFLDLQKAEAQAREAEIELSLERVRSKAMAMHGSSDILATTTTAFEELKKLGIHSIRCGIGLLSKNSMEAKVYASTTDSNGVFQTLVGARDMNDHPSLIRQYQSWLKQENLVDAMSGEELKSYYNKIFFQSSAISATPQNFDNKQYGYYYSFADGLFYSWTDEPYTENEINILNRFKAIVALTFRRFLDLQKAESQARESQIEVAVERVRAQSMAMHQTSDLDKVNQELLNQLHWLKINGLTGVTIWLIDENEQAKAWDLSSPGNMGDPNSYTVKYDPKKYPILGEPLQFFKTSQDYFTIDYPIEKIKKAIKEWREVNNDIANAIEEAIKNGNLKYQWNAFGRLSNGLLSIDLMTPPSDDTKTIVLKMAGAFNLAYKRFLDLQKAETQAREAKIELALERVRARTMAMHKSQEVMDVAVTLYDELQKLEFNFGAATIIIIDKVTGYMEHWLAGFIQKNHVESYSVNNIDHPIHAAQLSAWRKGEKFVSIELSGKALKAYAEEMMIHSGYKNLPDEEKALLLENDHAVFNMAYMKHGALMWAPSALSDEKAFILQRFANVFEQTYTRFLDLQKAEAQTREAQIETALEKVRSQSLAMHNSNEMEQVVGCLFDRLVELGLSFDGAMIFIFEKEKRNIGLWIATNQLSAPSQIDLPYDKEIENNQIIKDLWNAIEHGEHIINKAYSGEIKNDYFRYVAKYNESKIPESIRQLHLEKESWTAHFAAEKNSMIGFDTWSGHITKDEDFKILIRFAKVFEQAYTRFLDLQKAEVQAREAKIEAALERTRTQSMIMQHSKELDDTLRVFHEQVLLLGIDSAFSFLWLPDEDKDRHIFWAAWAENNSMDPLTKNGSTVFKSKAINYPMDRYEPATAQCLVDWKGIEPVVSYHVPPAGVGAYFAAWQELIEGVEQLKPEYFSDGLYYVEAFMKYGCFGVMAATDLSEEEKKILGRVAIEFERTYTRFLDLQKAEAQARAAQIEVAVERVRAKALAMHNSEEITGVAQILRKELGHLQIEGLFAATIYLEQDDGTVRLWDITIADNLIQNGPKSNWDLKVRLEELHPRLFIKMIWGSTEKYFVVEQTEQDFPILIDWVREFKKEDAEEIERAIIENNIKHTWFAGVQLEYGRMSIELLVPPPIEAESILSKIGAAFDLAYKRFLDLQKAEAQARDAQIELALERVRAKTMAMHHSNQLREIAGTTLEQLQGLGFIYGACSIVIMDEFSGDTTWWISGFEKYYPTGYRIPFFEHPFYLEQINNWKEGKKYAVMECSGEAKKAFDDVIFSKTEFVKIPAELQNIMKAFEKITFSNAYMKHGALSWSTEPIVDEQARILQRFAGVFEQSYTRFLDLQKAEAQARESQIQLALERVRARTMAMQRSDELMETAVVLFDQLNQLGENIERTIIGVMNEEERVVDVWATRSDGSQMVNMQNFPIDEPIVMQKVYTAWQQQKKSIVIDLRGEELERYFQFLKGRSPRLKRESFDERRVENFAFFSKGMLGIINADPNTPANVELYERFAAVFEQTYTRFLDLQKAEAQARESQIELGLERVRARAMAMQKSDELSELVDTVFKELTKLDFALTWCIINIIDEPTLSNTVWAANPDIDKLPESYHMLFEDYPFHHAMMKGWKERKTKQVYTLEGSEKKVYDEYLFNETEFRKVPEAAQATSMAMEKYVVSFSFSNFGGLQTVGDVSLSDANLDILSRFGKVFDLTYTRFNDLKQAEAQTRESQIQLALERVRARTMAMQRSDELKDAAALLFQQVKSLGAPAYSCGYNIWEKNEKEFTSWMSTQDGSIINGVPNIPLTEDANFIRYVESKEKGEPFFVLELRGERMQEHYEYLKTIPAFKAYFDYAVSVGFDLPETQIHHLANFSNGNLLFITLEPCPEFHDVFKRFAAVFEQTYTRFLDLQKAEAQVREAYIETALERVRSRSIGMQKSIELGEVVHLLDSEIDGLGIRVDSTSIITDYSEREKGLINWLSVRGRKYLEKFHVPIKVNQPVVRNFIDALTNGIDYYSEKYNKVEKDKYFKWLFKYSDFKKTPEERQLFVFNTQGWTRAVVLSKNSVLIFQRFIIEEFTEEESGIFKRFGRVFEQSYTRFLDLQKAEAQAREAQVEAALERVRSRSIGMQKSIELGEVVHLLDSEVYGLGIKVDNTSIITDFSEKEKGLNNWIASRGNSYLEKFHIPFNDNYPVSRNYTYALINGVDFFSEKYNKVEKDKYFRWLFKYSDFKNVSEGRQKSIYDAPGWTRAVVVSKNSLLIFQRFRVEEFTEEESGIFKRFGRVFEQSYTRFLDLQKAEAQAREAQIEAALERVRSRSMAMHKSEELLEAGEIIFVEMQKLGIESLTAGLVLMDKEEKNGLNYTPDPATKKISPLPIIIPHDETIHLQQVVENWKKASPFFIVEMDADETINHQIFIAERSTNFPLTTAQLLAISPAKLFLHNFYFKEGYVLIVGGAKLAADQIDIMLRFAKVFQQTYTRFLDLQKAEASAREAQIETALERVRSRSMGMQKSEELKQVIQVVYEQFVQLKIHIEHTGFIMDYKERDDMHIWLADQHEVPSQVTIPYFDSPHWNSYNEAKAKGKDLFVNHLSLEEKNKFYQDLFKLLPGVSEDAKEYYFNAPGLAISTVLLDNVGLYIENFSAIPYTDEENNTLLRFGKVFQQTYTRFLDLQKAETQTREAQIEVAVERVRAKALAMHKSDEIMSVAMTMRIELESLNIPGFSATTFTLRQDDGTIRLSDNTSAKQYEDGLWENTDIVFRLEKNNPDFYINRIWNSNKKYVVIEQDENDLLITINWISQFDIALAETIENYFKENEIKHAWHPAVQLTNGWLNLDFYTAPNPEIETILLKMGAAFDLAYKRFLDLQKAEAQTKEAIKRASVDRVRAEIASMRTTHDLERIIPLIWNELITLGVPFIRCGVFIVDEVQKQVQTLLSTPEGKSIASFQLPFENTEPLPDLLPHWQRKEIYKQHWDEAAFIESTKILMQRGAITESNQEQYTTAHRPTNLHLHFLPFLQGMLYVGSDVPLSDDELQLAQNLADAFSTAYARYEDFNKLEAANNKIEKTLVDLKQTQSQLIQSEKMASLGELTAGIAHEIQNPLNFVNNFSEVNKEILEEMKEELAIGNKQLATGNSQEAKIKIEQAIAIANDVIDNSEKINHHGKRAENIVKGMLQHSSKSTGIKEPTDINALADEYMRLSYHGLRAKDKNFNAVPIAIGIKMDLDPTLPLVNVIPQDIGRVLLNLFNNAFWACNERSKIFNHKSNDHKNQNDNDQALGSPEFETNSGVRGKTENEHPLYPPAPKGEQDFVYNPVVTLTTKNLIDKIEIRIRDNGPGIAPNIIDKIFQPFFTTKPTGQGTGLGLSLAYDIIKAHQGELTVETKVNEGLSARASAQAGTTFIIQLPAN